MNHLITFNYSKLQDIENHFESLSKIFTESLETRVKKTEYLHKLSTKSSRIEVWDKDCLIGLLCYYILENNTDVFITHISVSKSFEKQGIGQALLRKCLDRNQNKIIQLEVSLQNTRAIKLYKAFGFKQIHEGSDIITLHFRNVNS